MNRQKVDRDQGRRRRDRSGRRRPDRRRAAREGGQEGVVARGRRRTSAAAAWRCRTRASSSTSAATCSRTRARASPRSSSTSARSSSTAPCPADMPVWDHEHERWGSIRDRYSGDKDELKKVIKALLDTPYEELEKWDDRPLREWILQYTATRASIDLFEFISVLECMTEQLVRPLAPATTSTCARCTTPRRACAGYSFWPEQGWDGIFQDLHDAVVEHGGEVRLGTPVEKRRDRGRRGQGRDVGATRDPAERVLRGRGARGRLRDLHPARLERAAGRAGVGAARLVRGADPYLAQDHLRIAWLGLYLATERAGPRDRPARARHLAARARRARISRLLLQPDRDGPDDRRPRATTSTSPAGSSPARGRATSATSAQMFERFEDDLKTMYPGLREAVLAPPPPRARARPSA